ncbi:EAL domain-containing protein [Phycobacter sp. 'Weihai']
MAFQPIAALGAQKVFAYEALLRGQDGSGPRDVFKHVTPDTLYAFDQKCRTTSIELAARLDLAGDGALLSMNFLPNAVYDPKACIRLTLEMAKKTGFRVDRIMFEFTETERVDTRKLLDILTTYQRLGFKTAIDDFGAGYSGLKLLTMFQPDVVKLDAGLIRDIDTSRAKQAIVRNSIRMLEEMGVLIVCEGIETQDEYSALYDLGVDLMQGYLFARPGFETLPEPYWPSHEPAPMDRSQIR